MLYRATFLLRLVILFSGGVVLVFSAILYPEISREATMIAQAALIQGPQWAGFVDTAFLAGLYGAAIPFFFALFQALLFLGYVDKDKAFSAPALNAVAKIKYCALAICALYMVGIMPFIYCFAELDDAPGAIIIGFVIGLAPLVIAAFAEIFRKLLQEGADIKAMYESKIIT